MFFNKNSFKNFIFTNKFEIIIFLVVVILMLSNFSNPVLWGDEAETALLAKNTLLFGVPKTFDGKNYVIRNWKQLSPDNFATVTSWLFIYITSFSFMIFGLSTFSARLPFVIVGVISFFPIIALFRKISANRLHYYLSVIAFMLFVPYYLYSRQSRYYALLILLMPIIAISVYNLIFKDGSILWFVTAFVLLFHTNFISFIILMVAVSLYFLLFIVKSKFMNKNLLKKLTIAYSAIFIITFPFAVFIRLFDKLGVFELSFLFKLLGKFDFIMHSVNSTVPILLFGLSIAFMVFYYFGKKDEALTHKYSFVFFIGIVPIGVSLIPTLSDVRYLVGLIPLWISFILFPVVFLIQKREIALKVIGASILVLFIFTNVFYSIVFYSFAPFEKVIAEKCSNYVSKVPGVCEDWVDDNFIKPREVRYPFFYYLYEITHDYDGPIEGAVNYLNDNGDENSVVFTNSWYFPIQFYTNMRVLSPIEYTDTEQIPDFIVVNFPNRNDIEKIDFLISYAEDRGYSKVELEYPDLPWGNRPAMWYHKYWTQPIEVPLTIYLKTNTG
jgi:hypothetical protein